jgi:hypothetical protein
MTRASIVLLLMCGGIAARLESQTPASQVVASISGNVVDGTTGKPIAGAAILMQPATRRSSPESCGVSNFGDGQFLCEVYEPGDFQLIASYRGYGLAGFGMRAPDDVQQPFDLAAGEHATGVTLRMWRNGAVTGRALDVTGEPIVGATVSMLTVLPTGVHVATPTARRNATDDRGIYRLADVPAGNYVIALTRGPSSASPSSPIFYPNVASLAAARTVTVTAGAEVTGIDFAEARKRTFSVSGRLLGRAASRPAGYESHPALIRLLPADAPDTPPGFDLAATDVFARVGGAGARDRQGAFTFTNVPPGKYVVRIVDHPGPPAPSVTSLGVFTMGALHAPVPEGDTMWADVPVSVTDHDVTDIPVVLQRAARVSGRIVFDDAPVPQPLEDAPIYLVRADGRAYGDLPFGVSEPSGAFHTIGVPPGPYALIAFPSVMSPFNWRLSSVQLGGRNVADSTFDIGTTDITDVVVTMRLRVSTLSGYVRDSSGAPRSDTSLFIFSTDRSLWRPQLIPPMTGVPREVRPNRQGAYRVELLDGDYYVVATAERPKNWQTPESLAEFAKTGTRITMVPRETKTLDVVIR